MVYTLNFEGVEDGRNITFELHINNGSDDLGDLSLFECCGAEGPCKGLVEARFEYSCGQHNIYLRS